MAKIKVRYFVSRAPKNKLTKYYWSPNTALKKAGWKIQRLSDDYATALSQAQSINNDVDRWRTGIIKEPDSATRGTVDYIIQKYRGAREYKGLNQRTRKDYDVYLRLISDWAGQEQAVTITSRAVNTLYENMAKATPTKAAYLIRVLRLLFSFAERRSITPKNTNPATNMRISTKTEKQSIWEPEDVALMVRKADEMGYFSMGTAIMLNEWMGQRAGDVIKMNMNDYKSGIISIKQSKTGAHVSLPIDIVEKLRDRITIQIEKNIALTNATPQLIQQRDGTAFKSDWFSHLFRQIRDELLKKGIKGEDSLSEEQRKRIEKLKFQTLRHTAVTRLAESGCEIPEIAAITGHSFKACQDIVDRYGTRTKKMAQNAYQKRLKQEEGKDDDNI